MPGPVSKAAMSSPPDQKVTLATPPTFSTASGALQPRGPGPRQVVDRRQRRALPARGHVGGAEVEGHRHARSASASHCASPSCTVRPTRPSCGRSCSTVWPCMPIRSMSAPGQAVGRRGRPRRRRSAPRPPPRRPASKIAGSGVAARPAAAACAWPPASTSRVASRQLAFAGRAERCDRLAVGLQDRHVDGVQRGAGHESQDAHGRLTAMSADR